VAFSYALTMFTPSLLSLSGAPLAVAGPDLECSHEHFQISVTHASEDQCGCHSSPRTSCVSGLGGFTPALVFLTVEWGW
jgi:hypothetical protein